MSDIIAPEGPDVEHELPLKGLKVVEFCHVVMGPSCGLVLAELGAEVIKVEPAPGGDRTRNLKGHVAGSFAYFNRSKQSIGINLKTDDGRALAHKLIADADVVTENFAPGTADKLGIGYTELKKINPRLVYCSLKGYLPGPYENRTALDEVVQFNTGLAYMTGPPGRPLRTGSSVSDITGGLFGVVAILSALHRREKTGLGDRVQSGLYESCAFLVGQHLAGQATTKKPPDPLPVRPRSWGIYDTFPTGDTVEIFVAITSDKQWIAFCDEFGRDDLRNDERFDTNEKRRAEHDFLYEALTAMFREVAGAELIERLVKIGLPAAPVRKPGDLFDDPQLLGAGRMSRTAFPDGTHANLPRLPIVFAGSTAAASGQTPRCGEHTDEILRRLGLDEEEMARLRQQGIVV